MVVAAAGTPSPGVNVPRSTSRTSGAGADVDVELDGGSLGGVSATVAGGAAVAGPVSVVAVNAIVVVVGAVSGGVDVVLEAAAGTSFPAAEVTRTGEPSVRRFSTTTAPIATSRAASVTP
jgi:hypothetical protein